MKPELAETEFKKLHLNDDPNTGWVEGAPIKIGDTVTIYGKKKKRWVGKITKDLGSGKWESDNVKRVRSKEEKKQPDNDKGLEAISVTVTNTDGESNPEPSTTDIIP